MVIIHTRQIRFLLCPPYAAALKMAIIELIPAKFISGILSARSEICAIVMIKRIVEGKSRLQIKGIIAKATNVAAKKVFTVSGCKTQ